MKNLARDKVFEELRRMIIVGELAPGSLVSEADLLEVLGCGRTPLREALQQLNHEYLVEIPARRGILIPELSIVDYQQLGEAQQLMENECIRLAAARIKDQQLDEARSIVAQQEAASQDGRSYELTDMDQRFHVLIVDVANNRYLTDFAHRVHMLLARFVYHAYEAGGSAERSIAEHWQIVEALERRDADLASLRLGEHISRGRERVLRILGLGEGQE
jgi:DNA-binding GntR family transcriptional regulator